MSWRRRLAAVAILAWMAMLALGAWPSIVRPAFLDGLHDAAVVGIRLFGTSPGQPLFQTDVSPWKQHGYCFFVRDDARRVLFPPGGECRILGFHPRLPPVSRATHRMLSTAWELHEADAQDAAPSDAFVAAIGRAFCRKADPKPSSIEAVWVWYYKHYDDGRVARRNGVWFDYSCEREELGEVVWNPDDEVVLAHWGEAPW